jgi:uncharacterized membrane protein YkoI
MRYPSIVSRAAMAAALFLGAAAVPAAFGHEHGSSHAEHDEEKARAAVESGEILPLDKVVAALKTGVKGEISSIELEYERGIWVYEFKVISPRGRMIEAYVDAKSGKLIEKKGE